MIVAHIEKKIAEEVGELRAEVDLKRASDDGEVVVLPNPLQSPVTRPGGKVGSGQPLTPDAEVIHHLDAQTLFPPGHTWSGRHARSRER